MRKSDKLSIENTFSLLRTYCIKTEHILEKRNPPKKTATENRFYLDRIHSCKHAEIAKEREREREREKERARESDIYIYIERERERKILSLCVYTHVWGPW